MAKVRVFARAKAKAGKEMEVREILLGLVKASRAEDGVVFYELFETTDGGEFLFSEEYADAEGFEAHKSSDHFKQAGGAVQPLLDGELSIWVVDPVEPVL
jgi:quinol monooxygenase YgiN